MDFEGYWQENKGFVGRVAVGLVVFLIGMWIVDSLYADDIARESAQVRRLERDLEADMFDAADRDATLVDNEALAGAVAQLAGAVRFVPRPAFALDSDRGSAANQYLRALADVRERVLLRAGRANVSIEPGLGMPRLSPTGEDEIRRYLEALDLVEVVAGHAIDARIRRVDDIQVRLDPALSSRSGVERIERTLVVFSMIGDSFALTKVLGNTQRPSDGRVLHVHSAEVLPARGRERELRLELTLVLPRLLEASDGEEV